MATTPDINRWPIMIAIMLATFMQALDTTIANVALPHMMGSVSASADQITWVLTSYIVAGAIMTPLSSRIADLIGRKRTMMVCLTLFIVTSMFCGIASSLPEMVVYRFLQGLAGASLIPLSQAELLDINPPEKHGQAMAVWSGAALVAPALGPLAGGYLTDNLSWRWCFYINLPVGIIALLGIWLFMSNDRQTASARRFDGLGYLALAVFVTALQLMLDRGPTLDWFSSTEVFVEAMVALGALWVFVIHSMSVEHPFFDPALLRDRNFMPSAAFACMINMVLYGILALVPPLTQTLLGYSVMAAGVVMAPRGLASFFTMFLVPKLVQMLGPRAMLLTGLVITGVATFEMTKYDLTMGSGPLVFAGIIQGIGMGFLFVPITMLAFGTMAPRLRAEGSSIFALLRNLGGSFGIALIQGQVAVASQSMHSSLAGRIDPSDPVIAQGLAGAMDPTTAAGATLLGGEIARQSTMVAYLDMFRMMTVILFVCAPLTLVLKKPRGATDAAEAAAAAVD